MPLPSLLYPGCEEMPSNANLNYIPPGGERYTTKVGDDWWNLAARPDVKACKAGIDAIGLCEFNFQTRSGPEINWYLRNKAGCVATTRDKKNYKFAGGETIYLPIHTSASSVTPLSPTTLSRVTVQACVNVVKTDAEAKLRIESLLRYVPGGFSGAARNLLLTFCDSFARGKVKNCDPSEPNSYANKMVCTGIAEAASDAIERNKSRIPTLVSVGMESRDFPISHTAVLITIMDTGFAPADYVLDWWRSLDVNHPWVTSSADFLRGMNGYRF